jgi:hypothetical protein
MEERKAAAEKKLLEDEPALFAQINKEQQTKVSHMADVRGAADLVERPCYSESRNSSTSK